MKHGKNVFFEKHNDDTIVWNMYHPTHTITPPMKSMRDYFWKWCEETQNRKGNFYFFYIVPLFIFLLLLLFFFSGICGFNDIRVSYFT